MEQIFKGIAYVGLVTCQASISQIKEQKSGACQKASARTRK